MEAAKSPAQPMPGTADPAGGPFQPAGASSLQPAAGGPQAPFPIGGAASQQVSPSISGVAGAPQFGMAPGAPMNPEMVAMLAQLGFERK